MPTTFLYETFGGPTLDERLAWFCEPQSWQLADGQLVVESDAETDFWQRTHYGFRNDNGHILYAQVPGDFILTTYARFKPANQYDQAGLMIRLSADCWLKTSVEYEEGIPNRLGAVVTNHGYSDWSTQDFPDEQQELAFRIRRTGPDYIVDYRLDRDVEAENGWSQLRVCHLFEDDGRSAVPAGLYLCSPRGAGYEAAFDFLKIESV